MGGSCFHPLFGYCNLWEGCVSGLVMCTPPMFPSARCVHEYSLWSLSNTLPEAEVKDKDDAGSWELGGGGVEDRFKFKRTIYILAPAN